MSDEKASPTKTAADIGAAFAGFTLVLSEAIESGSMQSGEKG